MGFQEIIEVVGNVVDGVGVAAIVLGMLFALSSAATASFRRRSNVYSKFRRVLGRSILLGLELLVAADIIRTVAITPTLESVAVLAIIVVIRTFLSWTLELEMTGLWPWQKKPEAEPEPAAAAAAVAAQ